MGVSQRDSHPMTPTYCRMNITNETPTISLASHHIVRKADGEASFIQEMNRPDIMFQILRQSEILHFIESRFQDGTRAGEIHTEMIFTFSAKFVAGIQSEADFINHPAVELFIGKAVSAEV